MIGALSVAGLLGAVLALASSPATSQTVDVEVVAFQTDTVPGDYTVSWSTRGGCDPTKPNAKTTLATDGATGSRTGTVAAAGAKVEVSVHVADHCTYDWKAVFTDSKGVHCAVAYGIGDDDARDIAVGDTNHAWKSGNRDRTIDVMMADATFAETVVFVVEDGNGETRTTNADNSRISGYAGYVLPSGFTPASTDIVRCSTVSTVGVSIPRPVNEQGLPDQPHSGAILNTEFTVRTGQSTASGYKPNGECATVAGQTKVTDVKNNNNGLSSTNDDTVGTSLTVVRNPLSSAAHTCQYLLSVDLPPGFEPFPKSGPRLRGHQAHLTPVADLIPDKYLVADGPDTGTDPDEVTTTVDDCGKTVTTEDGVDNTFGNTDDVTATVTGQLCSVISLNVRVALRMIYVLQNVVGDSGGANAQYSLTLDKDCAIPHDLPKNLEAKQVGGIQHIPSTALVELREGYFNISAAVMGRDTTDVDDYGRTFAPRFALNKDAEPCTFTAKVSDLPDNCDATAKLVTVNAVTDADSHGRAIVDFDIGCQAQAVDTGDDMMDDGDDMMDDGDDMMGPPADVATG